MGKLMRAQLYVMLRSRFCLLFLGAALLLSVLLFFDNGDVVGSPRELEEMAAFRGFDGMLRYQEAEGAESIEEVMALLRVRQVTAAPSVAANGMILLLWLLPGITLAPALTKTRGMGRELGEFGRVKPLLSRMLLSWLFCLLVSTAMYLAFLRYWTDWKAAPGGLPVRNWLILQLCILAGVAYSYFVHVLLKKTWLAVLAMLLAEALPHRIVPGLRGFYPLDMIPYYTPAAWREAARLTAEGCPPGKLLGYCAVCAAYAVLCPLIAVCIFRRRDIP